ncbi:DUF2087 domain-containing protein [Bartonella sp. B10]
MKLDRETISSWGKIDFAWVDAGSLSDDVRFVITLWDHLSESAYLVLHEPTLLAPVNSNGNDLVHCVRSPIWKELLTRLDHSYEDITLPERHKYRQSGLGLIRKRTRSEQYSCHQSLQSALIALNELPIRDTQLPIGKERMQLQYKISSLHAAMTTEDLRSLYATIILRARTIKEISFMSKLAATIVRKGLNRLQNISSITLFSEGSRQIWQINADIWNEIDQFPKKDIRELSDRQSETPEILEKIASAFRCDETYSEAEMSKICSLFSDDYARLRRRLVDDGYLERHHGIYRRSFFSFL